jgi:selenocysteine lyase/cysteine desulfurase
MPIVANWSYLDHAAVGPLSGPAAAAIRGFSDQASLHGDTVWPQWVACAERLRGDVAAMIGAQTDEICLVPNTTTGINLVAEGWPWQEGDNVVIPEGEFPSNLFPWLNQQSRGVSLRMVPRRNREVSVDDLIAAIDSSTRIIAVSWVGYASGFRVDLESLVHQAHQHGVAVFVDAIQGLGVFPLDVKKVPIDFLAADGHKWLLGPEGAGVAMIRRRHLENLRCVNVGWGSVKNSYNYAEPDFTLRDAASRFESGSANLLGCSGLAASVDLFMQICRHHGPQAIGDRVIHLASELHEMLREIGIVSRLDSRPQHQSGIVTFEVPGCDPAKIRQAAAERKIAVSCRDGGIRASIHAYNTTDDLSRLVDVARAAIG